MRRKWTLRACFAHFGAECANPRWSWSARSTDGQTVVVTLWQDAIRQHRDLLTYRQEARTSGKSPVPGSKDRMANLIWARDHCDSLVRVVIVVANNVKANPRRIADCFPVDRLIMRITHLDAATGAFRLESVTKYPTDWLTPAIAGS
jgi:hypothetical protein